MNDSSRNSNDPPLQVQKEINEICTGFETDWRRDKDLKIERFDFDLDERWFRFALAELLLTEVDLRFSDGQKLDREEYYGRFAEWKNLVDAAFDRIEFNGYIELSECESVVTKWAFNPDAPETDSTDSEVLSPVGSRQIPKQIDGFIIEEYIGNGSFGVVFRARDTDNQQTVALKFPRHGRFATVKEMLRFLDEARLAQGLDHAGIVKTFKIGRKHGYIFIVQQFIDGHDLSSFAKTTLSHQDIARLIASVSEAVGFAHSNGLYHRDLKPSNILIDTKGNPWVIDFGLAILESVQRRRKGERVGSPAYMSPELVRGETHFIDGRSDIWSLGVILYELLIGRRPFKGEIADDTKNDLHVDRRRLIALFDEIKERDAIPLRQFDPEMSLELERICLRCLEKRISDRYLTATDLADDLRRWLSDPKEGIRPIEDDVEIAPQGLRSYGPDESAFFCRLLPGPRDRYGLPLSVRFWKKRIESFSPEVTFSIGFIYGPSGAGKSSFMRAGVLPRLAEHVIAIYVEATSQDTEVRVIKKLRDCFEGIPNDLSLPEIFDGLREGLWVPGDKKLLLVFDQFEQWLHAHKPALDEQLVQALRHCDGKNLQAICLVRDDFWLATTRFKDALEVEMVDGHNAMLVDRFDQDHARQVLAEFGRAYKQLPAKNSKITNDQDRFLDKVIEDLAEQRRVIPVRLSLFAEMFKSRPWTASELVNVGGVEGVGGKFLEETFSSTMAYAKHRLYREQILAVLGSLLPNPGIDIKGNLRSRSDLAAAAGLDPASPEFGQILKLLDGELRLITPTEPDTGITSSKQSIATATIEAQRYYQLTHDYLVPSIRDWIRTVQGRTRIGRAKLQLQELASGWHSAGRHHRFLPGFLEYCSILSGVPGKHWNGIERQFMGQANRFYGFCAVVTLLIVMASIGFFWKVRSNQRFTKTKGTVNQFMTCDAGSVSLLAGLLRDDGANAVSLLQEKFLEPQDPDKLFRTHIGLALLNNLDNERINFLVNAAFTCDNEECVNLVEALSKNREETIKVIEKATTATTNDTHWARLEILRMFLDPQHIARTNSQDVIQSPFEFQPDPTRRSMLIHMFKDWHGDLDQTLQMFDSTSDAATVSGLCISLGRIETEEFGQAVKTALQKKLEQLYMLDKNAAVHGASRWALTNWRVPPQPLTEPPEPVKGFDWWFNSQGMTMIRIPRGIVPNIRRNSENPDKVVNDFFLGSCEVTVQQFQNFLKDPDPNVMKPITWNLDNKTSFSNKLPVNSILREDAILFCNWLSIKEKLDVCYRVTGEKILIDGDNTRDGKRLEIDEWEEIPNANGYRLPSPNEWELAARCGHTTNYYFADDPGFDGTTEYIWCANNSMENGINVVHPVAQKIPNQFGLFDVLGNVNEMCWGHAEISQFQQPEIYVSFRGGGFRAGVVLCQLTNPWPSRIGDRVDINGFRVAKSFMK